MMNFIIQLSIVLMLGISSCRYDDFSEFGKKGKITLQQLNLPKDEALLGIVKQAVTEGERSNVKVKFYSVDLSDYNGGTIVNVVAETCEDLYGNKKYDGYYMYNDNLIVIYNKGSYKLPSKLQSKSATFKTIIPYPMKYDPPEFTYYIINGVYGWIVNNIGWVWVIPEDLDVTSKNGEIIVTVPQRSFK